MNFGDFMFGVLVGWVSLLAIAALLAEFKKR